MVFLYKFDQNTLIDSGDRVQTMLVLQSLFGLKDGMQTSCFESKFDI